MRPLAKLVGGRLTEKELELVPKSYDVVGSEEKAVAIIEIPEGLKNKKKFVAEAVMKLNRNVKSVLNKVSGRKGTYRLEDLRLVAGDRNTEVVHKEHGCLLKLNPKKVFFSPREATERQRIASHVKDGELVCVFFSGIAVYPIVICKKQPLVDKVYAIEINPDAHRYAQENVRINKLSHKIILINDDVKNVSKKLEIKFDRIVMPMVVGGEDYLNDAFGLLKKNGVIHFYSTGKEGNLFSDADEVVRKFAKKNKMKIKILNQVKILPFASRMYKICLDVKAGVPKPGLRG